VENLGGEPIRWTGFSLCAVGSLHRESGEAVIGTGYPLAFPAIAVRQSMGPGELRPVPLALERMTDDDIRHLDADRYEMIVDRCTLPFRVELPGPLHVEFSTSGV
jgi:hypothetical protein